MVTEDKYGKKRSIRAEAPKGFTQVGFDGTIAYAVNVDQREIRGVGLVTEAMWVRYSSTTMK